MDHRIESAVAVDDRHLNIRWTDGLEGIVDFSDLIDRDGPFAALRDPDLFRKVQVYEYGHTIFWLAEDGSEIDLCPDLLRAKIDPAVAAWIADEEERWHGRTAAERASRLSTSKRSSRP